MLFPRWETFYVIVGTAAAALTGLMFVVIALVADVRRASESTLEAFATPTVVHFCAALLLSAILAAPWPGLLSLRVSLALFGVAGLVYMAIVVRRAWRVVEYKPVFEDWLCHAVLPDIAYLLALVSALDLSRWPTIGLFTIGGVEMLLLFVGIHNAWDTITYVVTQHWDSRHRHEEPRRADALEERPL